MSTGINPYPLLYAAVQHHVLHYRDDLIKHDQRFLGYPANAGVPFLHWTRPHGTDMKFLFPFDHSLWPAHGVEVPYLFGHADRVHILDSIVITARYWHDYSGEGGIMAHHWTGTRLQPVTTAKALDIAGGHKLSTLDAWRKQLTRTNV